MLMIECESTMTKPKGREANQVVRGLSYDISLNISDISYEVANETHPPCSIHMS